MGPLVPTQPPDLLSISLNRYALLGGELADLWSYRPEQTVFGKSLTLVVTYNDELYAAQLRLLSTTIWTAAKIRVHAFHCVLALTFST